MFKYIFLIKLWVNSYNPGFMVEKLIAPKNGILS